MHALFHIRTVIIPRNRYQPEGFSPRVDIGLGMITVLRWKREETGVPGGNHGRKLTYIITYDMRF
jgi:hypothetical protein